MKNIVPDPWVVCVRRLDSTACEFFACTCVCTFPQQILVANNGIGAVKAIRSMRRWVSFFGFSVQTVVAPPPWGVSCRRKINSKSAHTGKYVISSCSKPTLCAAHCFLLRLLTIHTAGCEKKCRGKGKFRFNWWLYMSTLRVRMTTYQIGIFSSTALFRSKNNFTRHTLTRNTTAAI